MKTGIKAPTKGLKGAINKLLANNIASVLSIPAKDKAAFLEKIANSNSQFGPAEYWPNLKLIHTWTNGNCKLMVPKLKPWLKKKLQF